MDFRLRTLVESTGGRAETGPTPYVSEPSSRGKAVRRKLGDSGSGVSYQTTRRPSCTTRGELDCVVIVPNVLEVALRLGAPNVT